MAGTTSELWYKLFYGTSSGSYSVFDAKEICLSNGGSLATLASANEQDFVLSNQFLDSQGWTFTDWFWIGAYSETGASTAFKWARGSNLQADQAVDLSYVNWKSGHPESSPASTHIEIYLTYNANGGSTGEWKDLFPAGKIKGALCQFRI